MVNSIRTRGLLVSAMGLGLLLSYTNCSYNENLDTASTAAGSLAVQACRAAAKPAFSSSLYTFVRSRCTTCHTTTGGRPPFADSSLDTAFQTALSYTPDQFRANAQSAVHAQGITGPSLATSVQAAYDVWKPAYDQMSSCIASSSANGVTISVPDWSEGPPSHAGLPEVGVARFELAPKPLGLSVPPAPVGGNSYNYDPPMASPAKTVIWGLGSCTNPMASSELSSVPTGATSSFGCAQVQLGVRAFRNRAGQTGYLLSEPRLITSANQSLEISSMLFKVNGYYVVDGTAYKYILNKQVFMGGQNLNPKGEVLGGGSLIAFGPVKPSDFLSISIADLKTISMSPPPPMPRVSFALANQSVNEGNDTPTTVVDLNPKNRFTIVPVEVRLDRAPVDAPVTVLVTVNAAGMTALPAAQRAKGFRPVDPNANPNNQPDWDYRLGFADEFDPSGPSNYKVDAPSVAVTFYPPSSSGPGEVSKNIIITVARDLRREGNVVGSNRVESVVLGLSSPTRAEFGTQQTYRLDIIDEDNALQPGEPSYSQLISSGVLGSKCVRCHNSTMAAGGYDVTDYYRMIDRRVLIGGDVRSKMYQRMNGDDPAVVGLTPMPPPEDGGFLRTDERVPVENWIMNAGARNN